MAAYFNTPAVRKALHVEETPIETWPSPDVGFQYYKEYNACNWQATIKYPTTSMVDIYQEIIPQLERTWIYNGDTDPCVSYEGTREAVKQILLDEIDGTYSAIYILQLHLFVSCRCIFVPQICIRACFHSPLIIPIILF